MGEGSLTTDVSQIRGSSMGSGAVRVLRDGTLGRSHAEDIQFLVLGYAYVGVVQHRLPASRGLSRDQGPAVFGAVTASFGLVFSATRPPHFLTFFIENQLCSIFFTS